MIVPEEKAVSSSYFRGMDRGGKYKTSFRSNEEEYPASLDNGSLRRSERCFLPSPDASPSKLMAHSPVISASN